MSRQGHEIEAKPSEAGCYTDFPAPGSNCQLRLARRFDSQVRQVRLKVLCSVLRAMSRFALKVSQMQLTFPAWAMTQPT